MLGLESLPDPTDTWEIIETIGKGTYGKVYKVTNKRDGSLAAVKVLDPISVSNGSKLQPQYSVLCTLSIRLLFLVLGMIFMKPGMKSQNES